MGECLFCPHTLMQYSYYEYRDSAVTMPFAVFA